jgi:hypothetical protein
VRSKKNEKTSLGHPHDFLEKKVTDSAFVRSSDYHSHAEYLVKTLVLCAQCYAKINDHVHAIQYATEALQYNRLDSSALICRAKAFENEKL